MRGLIHRFPLLSTLSTLFVCPLFGQVDSGRFPAKYGPSAAEGFGVRPGITMAVIYGDNHQACSIDIRPTRSISAVPVALIQQLVDEIVPPSIRGGVKTKSGACDGGCWMNTEYDNFRIGQELGNPARDDGSGTVRLNPEAPAQPSLAVVAFKSCEQQNFSSFGQVDSGMLRAQYGPPTEEVFNVRTGITMAVTYGENRQVCKLEVRPARNAPSIISSTIIQQAIDEVVPPSTRGPSKGQFLSCAGAICWKLTEYESMSIGQSPGDVTPNPEAPTQRSLAVIQFKACQASKQ